MPIKESKEQIEKRVLEAEKVVVSNILHNWRRKYGMDYALFVRNGPCDVFARTRIGDAGYAEMVAEMKQALRDLGEL